MPLAPKRLQFPYPTGRVAICSRRHAAKRQRRLHVAPLAVDPPHPLPSILFEFLCPSDRAVSKDTGGGGDGPISPPIGPPPPPPPRSPLGLLPGPSQGPVTRVSSAHHEDVGELLASLASGPILIAYFDFSQAFPLANHLQLERTLRFLSIPKTSS
jgi:hypothetical protein